MSEGAPGRPRQTPKPTPTTGTRQPPQQPPDGASRKGSNVETPLSPEQGIGFSPRAEGLVVGGGTSTKPRRRERRMGRRLRHGQHRPGVSPGPEQPTTIHLTKSRRSSRGMRETPVREGDLPKSDAEADGGLAGHHLMLAATPPPTRPETWASTPGRRSPQSRCRPPPGVASPVFGVHRTRRRDESSAATSISAARACPTAASGGSEGEGKEGEGCGGGLGFSASDFTMDQKVT
jgi:hypothetical protein